ncbi:MAG TPA: ABC transporter substrate-binding protein [Candidatus Limnocylindria bacterium]|nr:ABC transporter substrate-binding protein [Candidatus Limnocylindria bacterium]
MSRSSALTLVVLIAVTACAPTGSAAVAPTAAGSATAEPLVKLAVAYDGISISTGPMQFTFEQGIFRKYGLDVELSPIAGGSLLTAAVVGGSVKLGQNGYEPALTAALQGADLVIIGGINNKLPYQLVVKPALAASGLKGSNARIAISRFGSSSDLAVKAIVQQQLKLDPKTDITELQIGGEPDRVAALESGQVDGTVLQYPLTATLLKKGYKIVGDATDLVDLPNTAYVTSRKTLAAERATLTKFFMAMIDGVHAYKTNPDAAIASTAKFLSVSVEDMRPAYDFYTKNVYPDVPRPSLTGIKNLFDTTISQTQASAKNAKPADFVDVSILDELEASGFVKQILAK